MKYFQTSSIIQEESLFYHRVSDKGWFTDPSTCSLYYKTITIVIMMIVSDAPNCGIITYDHN
jgi:hypothetical protein